MVWERSCTLTSALLRRTDRFFCKGGGGEEEPLFIPEKKGAGKIKKLLYS